MANENETSPSAPDVSKKEALFEIFRAAVWSQLAPGGREDVQDAMKAGVAVGVTDKDLDWLEGLDGKSFRAYFGEKAISKDLENAMKTADSFMEGMHYTPQFKKLGFYTPKK